MIKVMAMLFLCFCFFSTNLNAQTMHHDKDSLHISSEFEFVTLNGEKVGSQNLKGKVIVLDFWSTNCNPCRKAMPQMEKLYQHFKNNKDVAIYLVNSGWESIEKAKSFAESKREKFLFISYGTKYDLPFAYDNNSVTLKTFGFNANPSTVIIDTRFRIRDKKYEAIENVCDYLTKHVEQYLAEK